MSLLEKKDEEIFKIAEPIWDNLVKSSNMKDYGSFTKDFSSQMLYGANEVELGKQWAGNKLLTNLSQQKEFLGCLRREGFVTVLLKQRSDKIPGDFLGRLVLGIEGDKFGEVVITNFKGVVGGSVRSGNGESWEIKYQGSNRYCFVKATDLDANTCNSCSSKHLKINGHRMKLAHKPKPTEPRIKRGLGRQYA